MTFAQLWNAVQEHNQNLDNEETERFLYWCKKHEGYHETQIPKSESTIHAAERFKNSCE